MKIIASFLLFIIPLLNINAQGRFTVKSKHDKNSNLKYFIVDEKGNTLKELDKSKYLMCFNEDVLGYFSVFALTNEKGWIAIDINENKLFEVYNTSYGEPSPDELIENRIRIVDKKNRIGFADQKGKIIIQPQFEMVSSYYNGKAIVAESCEKISLEKEEHKGGCHHYSTVCKRNGYIDKNGNIKLIGNYTFEEIMKKIKWKYPQ